jgi:hypothetical protein
MSTLSLVSDLRTLSTSLWRNASSAVMMKLEHPAAEPLPVPLPLPFEPEPALPEPFEPEPLLPEPAEPEPVEPVPLLPLPADPVPDPAVPVPEPPLLAQLPEACAPVDANAMIDSPHIALFKRIPLTYTF